MKAKQFFKKRLRGKKWLIAFFLMLLAISASIILYVQYLSQDSYIITTPYLKSKIKSGQTASSFQADYLNGTPFSLDSFKGKLIILNFWISSCPYCLEEMPALEELYRQNKDKLVIIGVNTGEKYSRAKFYADSLNITYPLVMDKDDNAQRIYGIIYKPSTVFINPSGKIFKKINGPLSRNLLSYIVEEYLIGKNFTEEDVKWDMSNTLVSSKKIKKICEPDCLRYLYYPKFVDAKSAESFMSDGDLVIAVTVGARGKAYPIKILDWHEIVNDRINDTPIVVAYSSFGDAAQVFENKVEGDETIFGISGFIYENNPLLYDARTNTLWTQFEGEAIAGHLKGKKLNKIKNAVMRFGDWKELQPKGLVMSIDTGYLVKYYNYYPYKDYKSNRKILFPSEFSFFDRLSGHPKTIVYSLCIKESCKSYSESVIRYSVILNDKLADTEIKLIYDDQFNYVLGYDVANGKELELTRSFWFVWKSFHPNSKLVK